MVPKMRKTKSQELTPLKLKVYKPYDRLYHSDKLKIVCKAGRTTGKSYAVSDYIIKRVRHEDNCDVVVARAASESLRGSVYQLIQKRIIAMDILHEFEISLRPMTIIHKKSKNIISFVGIDSADINRSKGTETFHDVGVVWIEEANQMRSAEVLDSFLFTMYRFMKNDGKIIFTFNPELIITHWSHNYFDKLIRSGEAEYIYSTYLDIYKTLNPFVIKQIEDLKITDPNYFKYWFLGERVVFKGMIFPQFKEEKHVISKALVKEWLTGNYGIQPMAIVVGVDGGTKNDMTSLNPTLLLNNNVSILLNQFYHDPKKSMPLAPSQQSLYIKEFMQDIYSDYPELRYVPLSFIFDSDAGSQQLMNELRLNQGYTCTTVKGKAILEDINLFRDVLVSNIFFIVEQEGYKDYYRQTLEDGMPFKDEIQSYVYDEKTNDVKKDQVDHSLKAQIYVSKTLYSDNTFRNELGITVNPNRNVFRYAGRDYEY